MEIPKVTGAGKDALRQLLSYFCVGGIAAVIEWIGFSLFANVIRIDYLLSTVIAFVFSTSANWLLGRSWTFRENRRYAGKAGREALLVFAASGIGLLFNLALMYLFVSVLGMDTDLLKTLSKIAATGIVFIWNFLIRKLAIYK